MKEAIALLEKVQSNLKLCLLHNHTEEQQYIDQAISTLQQPKAQPGSEYPNSEFIKVQRVAAQLAADAYEEDQEWYPTKTSRLLEACDRLDTSEASRKKLLEACIEAQKVFGFIAENYKSCPHFPNAERLVDAAISNAKVE